MGLALRAIMGAVPAKNRPLPVRFTLLMTMVFLHASTALLNTEVGSWGRARGCGTAAAIGSKNRGHSGRAIVLSSMSRNSEVEESASEPLRRLSIVEDAGRSEESQRSSFLPAAAAGLLPEPQLIFASVAAVLLIVAAVISNQWSDELSYVGSAWRAVQSLDVGAVLSGVSARVDQLGPLGFLYFGAVYVIAEVLALPAVPLTASAGYLFGAVQGTAVVLVSATIAAGLSFLIGRFLLRGWVESIAAESPQFRAIDKAVQREGFKIVLLLRLSPIFPFALSNYFYGLTAVDFWPYLIATLIGFAPGTALYVR